MTTKGHAEKEIEKLLQMLTHELKSITNIVRTYIHMTEKNASASDLSTTALSEISERENNALSIIDKLKSNLSL